MLILRIRSRSEKAKILIDAGINFKELKKRLEEIKVKIEELDAILITHEHKDHIDGIKTIFKNKKIPIFSNSETAKRINAISRIDYSKIRKPIMDNLGNKFASLTDASLFHKINVATVCDILKGRHSKTRKGVSFEYI